MLVTLSQTCFNLHVTVVTKQMINKSGSLVIQSVQLLKPNYYVLE